VFEAQAVAAAYGLAIEVTDLGYWAPAMLVSEYDPHACTIRVNVRALTRYRRVRAGLTACDVRTFLDRAIAHELYHHREAIGEVPRLATRAEREAAADAYARAGVPADVRLEAFLRARRAE
jgi:hypothetical protein